MCLSKCLPRLTITPVELFFFRSCLPPNRNSHALATAHLTSWIRQTTYIVLRQVSTQPVDFRQVSTSWLFHVTQETLHRFQRCQARPERHTPTSFTKLRYEIDSAGVSFSEFSIRADCFSFLPTRSESTPFAPTSFMVSKTSSTSFVSAS